MNVTAEILAEILAHAGEAAPRECCGFIVQFKHHQRYVRARNIAESDDDFIVHPDDYTAAEDSGEVLMIVHSHYGVPPNPSDADRKGCELSSLPWLIMNYPTGAYQIIEPCGYRAPLIGRNYCYGVLDCLTLVQDYYEEVLGIMLPKYEYEEEWWNKSKNYYRERYPSAGFFTVNLNEIKVHDMILMQVDSPVLNHAGIYLGDGIFLHHPYKALSCRRPYGGYWQKHTGLVCRHKDVK